MKNRTKLLTPARSKALSKVLLNVFQLIVVGMFLSEAFAKSPLTWRVFAFVVMVGSFLVGIWFATDDRGEAA